MVSDYRIEVTLIRESTIFVVKEENDATSVVVGLLLPSNSKAFATCKCNKAKMTKSFQYHGIGCKLTSVDEAMALVKCDQHFNWTERCCLCLV